MSGNRKVAGGCDGGLVPALSWGLSQDMKAPIMNQVDCSPLAEDSIWKEGQREELASGWLFQDWPGSSLLGTTEYNVGMGGSSRV